MAELVVSTVMGVCGLALVISAIVVLKASRRLELTLRTAAACLVGAGGAVLVGDALSAGPLPAWCGTVLPVGVTLWIAHSFKRRAGGQMRRSSDWGRV